MASRKEAQEKAQDKQEYARGMLKADPSISNADINYYLERKFKAGGLNDNTINDIRAEFGVKLVGRGRGAHLEKIEPGQKTDTKAKEPEVVTERVLGAATPPPGAAAVQASKETATPAVAPVTPPAAPAAKTLSVAAPAGRTSLWAGNDEQRFSEMVIEFQAIMERNRMLLVSIPRKGDPHIQEVAERDIHINRAATNGGAAHH